MFQYIYPQFQFKAILREEMLEQLRDYPKKFLQLSFDGFQEGVVSGCGITWDNGKLKVNSGIVYRGENLYFMENPYIMECEPDNRKCYLKIQFLTEIQEPRKISGNTRIVINHDEPDTSCEMELCRFCLQDGARLRDKHETFEDFSTEYDTINLIHAPFASEGRSTLNPIILRKFAVETMKNRVSDPYDVSFAMNILANNGVISAECIYEYVDVKLEGEVQNNSNNVLYKCLLKILREQEHGGKKTDREFQGRKGILLV